MTTTLDCPNCGLQYPIADLGAIRGRKVRCRSCGHVWRVEADMPTMAAISPVSTPLSSASAGFAAANTDVMAADIGKAEAPPQQDVSRTLALEIPRAARPVEPPPAVTERRRLGRRQSTFDDVEAAIAALQSSVAQPAPPVPPAAPAVPAALPVSSARTPAPPPAPAEADFPLLNDAGPLEDSPFADDEFDQEPASGGVGPVIAWGVFLGVLAGLCFFAYTGRVAVVRAIPGAAAVYAGLGVPVNARGLEFFDIDTRWQVGAQGRPELSVTGQIKNVSADPQAVPTVVLAFQDEAGRELFDWATAVHMSSLPAGQTTPFTTVVPAPPDAVRNVEFRFAKLVH